MLGQSVPLDVTHSVRLGPQIDFTQWPRDTFCLFVDPTLSFFFLTGCLEFIFPLSARHSYRVSGRLTFGLDSKEWGSLNCFFGILLFWYKRSQLLLLATACLVYGEGKRGALMSQKPPEAWWLVAATQDWGLVLALPGWPKGCFFIASRAKSQVVVSLEA